MEAIQKDLHGSLTISINVGKASEEIKDISEYLYLLNLACRLLFTLSNELILLELLIFTGVVLLLSNNYLQLYILPFINLHAGIY